MIAEKTASPATSKVKFRLAGAAQPIMLLPVQVSGAGPFGFIVDTGARTSLLSLELARSLKIESTSKKQADLKCATSKSWPAISSPYSARPPAQN